MRKIIGLKANDFWLECRMENGEVYRYDMSFIQTEDGEMIAPLKNLSFFKKVFIETGSLSWTNGYEIHADTIVLESELIAKAA